MLNTAALLSALRPALSDLHADLAVRARDPGVQAALAKEHEAEVTARRTADPLAVWIHDRVGQIAAAWVLSVLFVRTLEDRKLCPPRLKGGADARAAFRALFPHLCDRDYLLAVFRALSQQRSIAQVFDAAHNPVQTLGPSAEAATALLERASDATAGLAAFDFSGDTRFLGDVYENLNEEVRKRYALLQTPDFVEAYLLDHTLEPALNARGVEVTVCDPTCGSGHLLLGAFRRIFARRKAEGAADVAAFKAIHQVYGADLNPYALAIARFRLVLAYLDAIAATSLQQGRDLKLKLAVSDSLLPPEGEAQQELGAGVDRAQQTLWKVNTHALRQDDDARRVFANPFDVVVGNPPYITPKDETLREMYRAKYKTAHMQYQLVVPFIERFFQLANSAGWVGAIVGNGFMKREFGKKLIEEFLPKHDLTAVVDTSGAYIPGHGTPTVILFGRHRSPTSPTVRCVMGKRGEPSMPEVPAEGVVWSSIAKNGETVGFDDEFISIDAVERGKMSHHPWSLRGGGASVLFSTIVARSNTTLGALAEEPIGRSVRIGSDEVFIRPKEAWLRERVAESSLRRMLRGDEVRDWSISDGEATLYPYVAPSYRVRTVRELDRDIIALWPYRALMAARGTFKGDMEASGRTWYEYMQHTKSAYERPLSIAFAFVATHNHFVLDRGAKVFNRSAPIIKLPADATEEDYLALLGYLNSSTACFWMKQVCFDKGGQGINQGFKSSNWRRDYEFDATKLRMMPIPAGIARLVPLAREASRLAASMESDSPETFLAEEGVSSSMDVKALFEIRRGKVNMNMVRLVEIQEEIDWIVYELMGFPSAVATKPSGIGLVPTFRAFERLLGEAFNAGEPHAVDWYNLHGWTPPHEGNPVPEITKERLRLIASDSSLRLLEDPAYKRRWYKADHEKAERAALRTFLLNALETSIQTRKAPASLRDLAHTLATDPKVMSVAQVLTGHDDPDLATLLSELALTDAVPFLPAWTFKPTGMVKHEAWLHTWAMQRREDAGEAVVVPLPPKYDSVDYTKPAYWQLRGKLDVPKERFILYPACSTDVDPSVVIGWAGWDHAQRIEALYALHKRLAGQKQPADLVPLVAGLYALLPWVQQWHGDEDPYGMGQPLGAVWAARVESVRRLAGLSEDDLRAWRPEKGKPGRPAKVTRTPDEVLAAISGGVTHDALAEALGLTGAALKPLTTALEADGLIRVVSKRPRAYALASEGS